MLGDHRQPDREQAGHGDHAAHRQGTRPPDLGWWNILSSFPAPQVLRELGGRLGLPERKIDRLRGVADAAHEGELTAPVLRDMETGEALRFLQRLPGVGPFSAELVLARGAGHPDVFPRDEFGVHKEMALAYGADPADVASLEYIAESWRPFRSWVTLLFRVSREERVR